MTLAPQFLDALVDRADAPGGIAFDDAKLAQATLAFDAALQSRDAREVTQELLTVAFFLEAKKGARDAALAVVAVARRAIPALQRTGVSFDDVAASAEKKAAALLGTTTSNRPSGDAAGQKGAAGAKWWQVR